MNPPALSLCEIETLIAAHHDFPQKGVRFRDIFPIFRNPAATRSLVQHVATWIRDNVAQPIDVIVGLEARGFLLGPMIAQEFNAAFVPVRKKGKLPGVVTQFTYCKEYGKDTFELQSDSILPGQRVVIFDDLIATGGSAAAAVHLVHQQQAIVAAAVFLVELRDMNGVKSLPSDTVVHSLYQY